MNEQDNHCWLPAGEELDLLALAEIFGSDMPAKRQRDGQLIRGLRFSRDERAAVDLLDMQTSTFVASPATSVMLTLNKRRDRNSWWQCCMYGPGWECDGEGPTLPLAVARATMHINQDEEPTQTPGQVTPPTAPDQLG